MAELTLDAADLVAGESGPLMTAIGAMLIEASILATRAVARGASGGDSSSAEVERAMELIEGIRRSGDFVASATFTPYAHSATTTTEISSPSSLVARLKSLRPRRQR